MTTGFNLMTWWPLYQPMKKSWSTQLTYDTTGFNLMTWWPLYQSMKESYKVHHPPLISDHTTRIMTYNQPMKKMT